MAGEEDSWKVGFGKRLRAARLARGFRSARTLAAVIGVEENTVTTWERGERRPGPLEMLKLKRTLGVSLDYLYAGDRSALSADLMLKLLELDAPVDMTSQDMPRR